MSTENITTISPSTNKPVLTREGLSADGLLQVGEAAQKAFKAFRKSHPTLESRQTIVKKALEILESRQDALAKEITEQMGRPIAYTSKEIATALLRARYMLRIAPEALAPTPGDSETNFKRYIEKLPVGVVLVIFAWNYPYLILVNSLIPCILAGDAVILKPSPQTPTIAEHMAEIFKEAGLPERVIQYVHCGTPTDLEPLILSPNVNHVTFTGGVAGGLAVQKIAASRIDLSVGLELGGKDPSYVRADVDPAWAADEIVDGAVFNSGQSCCSIERVYVHEKVYDAFVSEVQKVLAGYKLGDPSSKDTNIGPVVSTRAKEAILKQVADAKAAGAKDETPENSTFKNLPTEGNYVAPVLLTGVDHSMAVMKDETFGPVVPIMKVSSDEEAIDLMNDSQFGLTATIWTKDVPRGEELADQVEAGTVFVNRADYPSPDLAWTGWKESGKGVSMGRFGFEQFVKLRSVHIKNYPK
ncbi:Aldehyde dehydrogenase [Cyphellophora attinorum]|uniref:aldehyde dehydrogenase (NAD(+)) n=1 Tax=Cyphellophora attinorum TaxID=1664694 RepID=A0A0N0NKR1_9EURO|nr:Aldehyde dehydrogenase [Phialophora attinorum]KPI38129.1 Aldehyde dehydrogenase [Phialophora attinorum]